MNKLSQDPCVALMRDAVILAAESMIRMPAEAFITFPFQWRTVDPSRLDEPWDALHQRWLTRMAEPIADGLTPLDFSLLCCVAAAELHMEAAAAFSILAEDDRLFLPTPMSFARLIAGGFDARFEDALQVSLEGGKLHQLGLLESIESIHGPKPLSQQGLRLLVNQRSVLFDEPHLSTNTLAVEIEPYCSELVFVDEISAAKRLLAQYNCIWIRAESHRSARQFALDLSSACRVDAMFNTLQEGVVPDLSAIARTEELFIADLFSLTSDAPLWLWQAKKAQCQMVVLAPTKVAHPGFDALDAPLFSARHAQRVWDICSLSQSDRFALSDRFSPTTIELRAAIREAQLGTQSEHAADKDVGAAAIAQALLNDGARRMGHNVAVVQTEVTLDDLVAPPLLKMQLKDAVAWRRNSKVVYEQMGLRADSADGRGLSLLFSGPPGSGKTFAARGLANALGLNLYRIDLSQVVSKYIGETEKALARIFDEAEAGHGLLFFDEADAVFGKRSEVKDAHDRYANIEVGYLLQRMESFDGVMALATNLRSNLDQAFLRRIKFILEFALPSRSARRALWERNLPSKQWCMPDLDINMLSERFRLSGGNIRNAAVAAAHLAADENLPVGPQHLSIALYRELQKSGLPRGEQDMGPLASYLPKGF